MKTGLFGRTFNPVHSGHVLIMADIIDAYSLDSVIIVPAAVPPHKPADYMADINLRLEMTRLAFADLPRCRVSDIETKRGGRSYTVDTVHYFLKTLPSKPALFFIVGLDAFLELDTWKDYMALLKTIPFIVINRLLPGGAEQQALASFLTSKISPGYAFSPQGSVFVDDNFMPVFFYKTSAIDISSTQIRERLKTGRPVQDMLPDDVEQFIKERGLYQ
jgi:nicotinate-nucleotide adenylyltransferase